MASDRFGLDKLRARYQVVILSDTFAEFAEQVLGRLLGALHSGEERAGHLTEIIALYEARLATFKRELMELTR